MGASITAGVVTMRPVARPFSSYTLTRGLAAACTYITHHHHDYHQTDLTNTKHCIISRTTAVFFSQYPCIPGNWNFLSHVLSLPAEKLYRGNSQERKFHNSVPYSLSHIFTIRYVPLNSASTL